MRAAYASISRRADGRGNTPPRRRRAACSHLVMSLPSVDERATTMGSKKWSSPSSSELTSSGRTARPAPTSRRARLRFCCSTRSTHTSQRVMYSALRRKNAFHVLALNAASPCSSSKAATMRSSRVGSSLPSVARSTCMVAPLSSVRPQLSQRSFLFVSMMPTMSLWYMRRRRALPSQKRSSCALLSLSGALLQLRRCSSSRSSSSSELMSSRPPAMRLPSPMFIRSMYTSRMYSMFGRPSAPGICSVRGVSSSVRCCSTHGRLRSRKRCRKRSLLSACSSSRSASRSAARPSPTASLAAMSSSMVPSRWRFFHRPRMSDRRISSTFMMRQNVHMKMRMRPNATSEKKL
mmetsp:Transcript_24820/g.86426  ORF Transcript_24820/g.86426 Transcript_24820/m.86426 type:complete len:349 (+) Transcript_24820:39-1085(+)